MMKERFFSLSDEADQKKTIERDKIFMIRMDSVRPRIPWQTYRMKRKQIKKRTVGQRARMGLVPDATKAVVERVRAGAIVLAIHIASLHLRCLIVSTPGLA